MTTVLICPDSSGKAVAIYEIEPVSERFEVGPDGETVRRVFAMGKCLASSVNREFASDVAAFLCEVLETRAIPTVGEIMKDDHDRPSTGGER